MYVAVTDNNNICSCNLLTTSTYVHFVCGSNWQKVHVYVPITDNYFTYMCQLLTAITIELASYWQQLHMYMSVTDN